MGDFSLASLIRYIGALAAFCFHLFGLCLPLLLKSVSVANDHATISRSLVQSLELLVNSGNWALAFCVLTTVILIPLLRHCTSPFPAIRRFHSISIIYAFDMTPVLVCAVVLVVFQLPDARLGVGISLLILSIITPFASEGLASWLQSCQHTPRLVAKPSQGVHWLLVVSALVFAASFTMPFLHTAFGPWSTSKSLLGGISMLYTSGAKGLALILIAFSVLFPSLKIAALLAFNSNRLNLPRWQLGTVIAAGPWSFIDVFAILVIVLYHLIGFAVSAKPGAGLWLFMISIILSTIGSHLIKYSENLAMPVTPPAKPPLPITPGKKNWGKITVKVVAFSCAFLVLLATSYFFVRDNPSIVGYSNLRLSVLRERISQRQQGKTIPQSSFDNDLEFYLEVSALANKVESLPLDNQDRKEVIVDLQKCLDEKCAINEFGKEICIAALSGRLRCSDAAFIANLEKLKQAHIRIPIRRDQVFEHHEFLSTLNDAIENCKDQEQLAIWLKESSSTPPTRSDKTTDQ